MHVQVAAFLDEYKDDLPVLFDWYFDESIPRKRFGFSFGDGSTFEKTLELKTQLTSATIKSRAPLAQVRLAEYVIKDWGGIKRFGQANATVTTLLPLATKTRPGKAKGQFPFKNISSWSKWLSVICPDWALIYDARVAYSLNAINLMAGAPGMVFPMPQGRNSTLQLLDPASVALASRLRTTKEETPELIRKAHVLADDDVYDSYLDVATGAHNLLWPNNEQPLVLVEMLLFALANNVVFRRLVEFLRCPAEPVAMARA